jgi:hypothetical protein
MGGNLKNWLKFNSIFIFFDNPEFFLFKKLLFKKEKKKKRKKEWVLFLQLYNKIWNHWFHPKKKKKKKK